MPEHDTKNYYDAVRMFTHGDYSSCIDVFLRLSSEGNARATLYAATIFDRGGGGVICDWKRARKLYQKSLTQSYSPGAALGLALMLYKGRGGSQDFFEAARYFEMLRENAFSEIMLGVMSIEGQGCKQSEENALRHFDKAWLLRHPLGLKNASIIRFRRGYYMMSTLNFFRASFSIFWSYGIKRLPLIRSPTDIGEFIF